MYKLYQPSVIFFVEISGTIIVKYTEKFKHKQEGQRDTHHQKSKEYLNSKTSQ